MPRPEFQFCAYITLFWFLFVHDASAIKRLEFYIDRQNNNCSFSLHNTVEVEKNEMIQVFFYGYHRSDEILCSLADNSKEPFLKWKNLIWNPENQSAYANITAQSKLHNGLWNCRVSKNEETLNTSLLVCTADVRVAAVVSSAISTSTSKELIAAVSSSSANGTGASEEIAGLPKDIFYMIVGGVVGALVLIIIVVQSWIIIHFRIGSRSRLSNLERRHPSSRDDTARYSTTPMRSISRKKGHSSGIYQSLENLRSVPKTPPNMKNRPPLPLPMFYDSDDDSQVYGDGSTLTRMFTPEPPPLDSLPRKKEKVKPRPKVAPKPKADYPDESDHLPDYDYADNEGPLLHRQLFLTKQVQPKPVKSDTSSRGKQRTVTTKPPTPCAASPVVSELDNIFKKRNQNARSPERTFEPNSNHHQVHRKPGAGLRGPPVREVRPTNERTLPRPALDPRPAQNTRPLPQGQRYPEDVRSSEARNQDLRPQNVRFPERPEERAKPPMRKRPDLARTPQTTMMPGVQMMKSPPLPRKPAQVPDVTMPPPLPGPKRQLPVSPTADTESVYEPVADSGSSDDDEWKIEPLKPYNIYNV